MQTPAQRFELSTRRPHTWRDDDLPEAYVVNVHDDGTVGLVADLDLPVITFPTLTPAEAERIGLALLEAADKARGEGMTVDQAVTAIEAHRAKRR